MSGPIRANNVDHLEAELNRLSGLADGGERAIDQRLQALDDEWSAGRVARVTCGSLILGGIALSVFHSRWWLALPTLGGILLLESLFRRKSALVSFLRLQGLRSSAEIEQEKQVLKALRGDFRGIPTIHEVEDKEEIARMEGEGGLVLESETSKPDVREAVRTALDVTRH